MANIIFNIAAFVCEKPIMKDIYRYGDSYRLNWSSLWDDYVAMGINATITLYFTSDGHPEQLYTGIALPFPGNADMYFIQDQFGGMDQTDFRFVFEIEGSCTFEFIIPYSQVIKV